MQETNASFNFQCHIPPRIIPCNGCYYLKELFQLENVLVILYQFGKGIKPIAQFKDKDDNLKETSA